MTVGIAAISQERSDPKVVLAADRMITTGQNPRIEYEHTRSKIKPIHDNSIVSCMAIASGTVSFIEEFFTKLEDKFSDQDPTGVRQIADEARDAYTEVGRQTVENQVLEKFDLSISDLTNGGTAFESDVLSSFLSDVADAQDDFSRQLEVLVGGVDPQGAHIFSIQGFDLNPQNTIGYHAVGSGTQPARSVFIRNEYSTDTDVSESIINTIEAKVQAEEARGVGRKMDLAVVNRPQEDEQCCEEFSREKKDKWVELYEDIIEAEQQKRREVISDADPEYTRGEIDENS
ncbi:hypothetical protein GJ633_09390 [Halorubrum sp. CBA1125]|uniref:hypothetical protein n=1 Tax=Halorubrum sp. CBA1125 TaxID=2668072 RepID=UPI0012E86469|nr:hypothetical protein [Halorubrum sp. CBA1125]MUW14853.1 hypothetical protein [Halorubrum sp. CBA1125]